jgi:hypothetical protein
LSRTFRRPAALLVLLATASASAEPRTSTAIWCETATSEFHIVSDLPELEQHQLIRKLERVERLAEPFLPGEPLARRSTLKLVVFRNRQDFLTLTGKRKFAGYMQPSLQTNRLLIGPIRGDVTETALHEYAHYLLRNRTGVSLPAWFDEGLASLLGTTEFSEDAALIGTLPITRMESRLSRNAETRPPQQRLMRTLEAISVEDWRREQIHEFYDLAWLLTHYLYFDVYNDALTQGEIGSSALAQFLNARDRSLPEHLGMRPSQLIRALEKHLSRWRSPEPVSSPASTPPDTRFRCLDPVERDLALAMAVHIQAPELARSLISTYLEHASVDPENGQQTAALKVAMARVEIASEKPEAGQQLLEEVLAFKPNHAEATVLAADLLVQACLFERGQTCREKWQIASGMYRTALRQDPTRYDGVLGIGLSELHRGRAGDAVNYLKVAYARAPWAAVINYYLGESYRLMGDSRASIYLENARNWAVQDIWRLAAEESLRMMIESDQGSL